VEQRIVAHHFRWRLAEAQKTGAAATAASSSTAASLTPTGQAHRLHVGAAIVIRFERADPVAVGGGNLCGAGRLAIPGGRPLAQLWSWRANDRERLPRCRRPSIQSCGTHGALEGASVFRVGVGPLLLVHPSCLTVPIKTPAPELKCGVTPSAFARAATRAATSGPPQSSLAKTWTLAPPDIGSNGVVVDASGQEFFVDGAEIALQLGVDHLIEDVALGWKNSTAL
jgi:hypothetical protein